LPEIVTIECPSCEESFCNGDYNEDNPSDMCSCGNIAIEIIKYENSKYPFYVGISYEKEKPIIDAIMIEDDDD
tara:strand:+ start:198 stop:416 length:219 start_codon:yes stop_codon:yes gene_type:complete